MPCRLFPQAILDPFKQGFLFAVVQDPDVEKFHRADAVDCKKRQCRHLWIRGIRPYPIEEIPFMAADRCQHVGIFSQGRKKAGGWWRIVLPLGVELSNIGADDGVGLAGVFLGTDGGVETCQVILDKSLHQAAFRREMIEQPAF